MLLVLVLWIVSFLAASLLDYRDAASLWYPPAAVSFAAFVVFRWRAWPAVLLANAWAWWRTVHVLSLRLDEWQLLFGGLGYALSHAVPYWLLARVVLRSIPRNAVPSLPKTVATFLISGLGVAALAAFAAALSAAAALPAAERARQIEAARRRAEGFTWDASAEKLWAVLKQVANRK